MGARGRRGFDARRQWGVGRIADRGDARISRALRAQACIVAASGEQTVHSSIFGPEWPHFNPMRVIRNRVVEEWIDRLSEVPTRRDDLPEIRRTRFLGQEMVLRKFNVILATEDTMGDWEEMPGWPDKESALSTTFLGHRGADDGGGWRYPRSPFPRDTAMIRLGLSRHFL